MKCSPHSRLSSKREYWRMADQERSGVARLSLNPMRKELSSLWWLPVGSNFFSSQKIKKR